jgi:hypothetical protein
LRVTVIGIEHYLPSILCAECALNRDRQLGKGDGFDIGLRGGFERLGAAIPFLAAYPVLHRREGIGDQRRITPDSEVDILREPLDDAIGFGQGRAALECQMLRESGRLAQAAQRPADPEILFDDDRRDIAPRRRLIDEGEAIIGGPACKFIHVEPNLS